VKPRASANPLWNSWGQPPVFRVTQPGRQVMPNRWPVVLFVLGVASGCGQDGNQGEDERDQGEKVRTFLESPEYKKAFEERRALMEKEDAVLEEAGWIGKTGLSEELERELPRYLRRELGQSLFDADSMKAADLAYAGSFLEGGKTIHYWRIPEEQVSTAFAYVEVSATGSTLMGWGSRKPPHY
jgi:hypothetical protein